MNSHNVPSVVFHTRVRNDALAADNPFEWKDVTSDKIFTGRNIVLLAVPGAFTPACSESHLPGFEEAYDTFKALGVDEVVCISVNDAFVMFRWSKDLAVSQIRMLPDGNGEFTEKMGMLVNREDHGMGQRSWRYSAYVEDRKILKVFSEPGKRENPSGVPVTVSDAQTMLRFLSLRKNLQL